MKNARTIRAYAGVRPLFASEALGREASRSYKIVHHSGEGADNLISIIGGKLTTYRSMAEKVCDLAVHLLGRNGSCVTSKEPLFGTDGTRPKDIVPSPVDDVPLPGTTAGGTIGTDADLQGSMTACSCEGIFAR